FDVDLATTSFCPMNLRFDAAASPDSHECSLSIYVADIEGFGLSADMDIKLDAPPGWVLSKEIKTGSANLVSGHPKFDARSKIRDKIVTVTYTIARSAHHDWTFGTKSTLFLASLAC
ncbi:hypothetical protein PENTCL1PPCAC_9699, partial [Pristionchus entomophagus]